MKIVDIWTLENIHQKKLDKWDKESLFKIARSIKYSVRVLWPELAGELDNLAKEEARKLIMIEEYKLLIK